MTQYDAIVQTTGTGSITLTGTGGGSGASSTNYGVYITGDSSVATAYSGANAAYGTITINGTGGNAGGSGSNNFGVYIGNNGDGLTSPGGGSIFLGHGKVVTIKSADDIVTDTASTLTTGGGNITLDSDIAAAGGAIVVGGNITSNGGNITLGGGTDPTTMAAIGDSANTAGITINNAVLDASGQRAGIFQ